MAQEQKMTRRQWLEFAAMTNDVPWWLAKEAVSTTFIEHPEWDPDEEKTMQEWYDAQ